MHPAYVLFHGTTRLNAAYRIFSLCSWICCLAPAARPRGLLRAPSCHTAPPSRTPAAYTLPGVPDASPLPAGGAGHNALWCEPSVALLPAVLSAAACARHPARATTALLPSSGRVLRLCHLLRRYTLPCFTSPPAHRGGSAVAPTLRAASRSFCTKARCYRAGAGSTIPPPLALLLSDADCRLDNARHARQAACIYNTPSPPLPMSSTAGWRHFYGFGRRVATPSRTLLSFRCCSPSSANIQDSACTSASIGRALLPARARHAFLPRTFLHHARLPRSPSHHRCLRQLSSSGGSRLSISRERSPTISRTIRAYCAHALPRARRTRARGRDRWDPLCHGDKRL